MNDFVFWIMAAALIVGSAETLHLSHQLDQKSDCHLAYVPSAPTGITSFVYDENGKVIFQARGKVTVVTQW